MASYQDLLNHQAQLFKSRVKNVDVKDVAFRRKLDRMNREISQLDAMILVYRRKLEALDVRASDRHQKLRELKWMLMELQARAARAKDMMEDLKQEHLSCVKEVELLVDQFEQMFGEEETGKEEI